MCENLCAPNLALYIFDGFYLVMWFLCPGLHLALATENGVDTVNLSFGRPVEVTPS